MSTPESKQVRISAAVAVDPFHLPLRQALDTAGELGFGGIALGVGHKDFALLQASASARRDFVKHLQRRGLSLAALRVAAGPAGLFDAGGLDQLVQQSLRTMLVARELGAQRVSLFVGQPSSAAQSTDSAQQAATTLTEQADRCDVPLALSSSNAVFLKQLLTQIAAPHYAMANLDALRLLAGGQKPRDVAEMLAGHIGQCTLADAILLGQRVEPVGLGQGMAQPGEVLAVLREQGFNGPLVADVNALPQPLAGARRAAEELRRLLKAK